MIPYLLMLAVPGSLALTAARRPAAAWIVVTILYFVMVGLRFQVGMDWDNYLSHYRGAAGLSLPDVLFRTEPGFQLLMWIGHNIVGGYPLVNAIAGLFFCWGFFAVARRTHEPFLGIVAATPLLVVAFAMTATRQSMAMGIIFYLYSTWASRSLNGRIVAIGIASLFHFSSIFILVFVALSQQSRFARIGGTLASLAMMLLVIYLFPSTVEAYGELYVASGDRKYEAPGAIIHVGILAAAATAYFGFRKAWLRVHGHHPLYHNLAFAALMTMAVIPFSSVGAYRFSVYLWPMAMYVVSGIPPLMANPVNRGLYRLLIFMGAGVLLLAWLTTSNNGFAWLPYQNWLLQPENVRLGRG